MSQYVWSVSACETSSCSAQLYRGKCSGHLCVIKWIFINWTHPCDQLPGQETKPCCNPNHFRDWGRKIKDWGQPGQFNKKLFRISGLFCFVLFLCRSPVGSVPSTVKKSNQMTSPAPPVRVYLEHPELWMRDDTHLLLCKKKKKQDGVYSRPKKNLNCNPKTNLEKWREREQMGFT